MSDLISRQAAIDALEKIPVREFKKTDGLLDALISIGQVYRALKQLPPVQPEPLSDAYTKAVWTWLLDYQIKAAKLKGRYTPYEVLSWVANDWRKENEGSD